MVRESGRDVKLLTGRSRTCILGLNLFWMNGFICFQGSRQSFY